MVTKIIACADIHIRNLRRMDEYEEQLTKFINECKTIVKTNGKANTRIAIAGDIFQNYIEISAEGYVFATWFFKELDKICKTVIIAGNHDINSNNLARLDPLSVIFSNDTFKNCIYLDKELNYESGCYIDDNITWAVYSIFDNFARPNIEEARISNPNNKVVGLFHGMVQGSKTDTNYIVENGVPASVFDGTDFTIMGHIHKRQTLEYHGIPIEYCGSLIQQNHGENISNHGFSIWDVEKECSTIKNIANENFSFFTFAINFIDDLDNDTEEIINL